MTPTHPARRGAAGAVLVVALGLLAACSGASSSDGEPGSGPSPSSSAGAEDLAAQQAQALDEATATVETAVGAAESDAPLPASTTPELGDDLLYSRADLGACDYGDYDTSSGELCPRGDTDADRSFVVLGDSHGRHWAPALDQVGEADGWTGYYLVKQQCTASLTDVVDPREGPSGGPWEACADFRDWALDQVAEIDPDVVIVSTSPPIDGVYTKRGHTDDPAVQTQVYRNGFDDLFGRIAEVTDARTVLLEDIPVRAAGTEAEVCLTDAANTQADCLSPQDADQLTTRFTEASVRAAEASDVEVVDPSPLVCWEGSCPGVIGEDLLPYRGRNHLTVEYVDTLAAPLASLLGM